MAEGDEIRNTDLVQEDAFGDFKQSAKEAYEMLKLLDEGIVSLGKNMRSTFNGPAEINNVKGLEDYLTKLKEVDELEKSHTTVIEKKAKAVKVLTVEEQKAKLVIQEKNKATKEEAKDQLGLRTAYQRAAKTLDELRDAYKNLAIAGRENGVVGRGLLQMVTEQDQKLKGLDGTVGQHQRNVGNYTKSVIILQKGLGGLTGLIATVGRTFGLNTEYLEGFHNVSKTLIKTSKELQHTLHLEHLGHKENTGAIVEETAAEEASGVAKTLSLGAIGLIIAATAALAGGIWYLVNAQEESYQETLKEIKAHNALEGALEKEIIARAKLDKKLIETKDKTKVLTGQEGEAEAKRKELLMELNVQFGELQHEKNEAIRKEEEYYIEQHHLGVRNATKYHEDAMENIEKKYAIKRRELLRQYAADEEQINVEALLKQGEDLDKHFDKLLDKQKDYAKKQEDEVKREHEKIQKIIDDLNRDVLPGSIKYEKEQEAEKKKREEDFDEEIDQYVKHAAKQLEIDMKLMEQQAEIAKRKKELRDKEIDEAAATAKSIFEIKQKYNEFEYKNKTDFLNRQNQMLSDDMQIQAKLLSEGKGNQYAQEQRARAENMAKQADLDKKAYRQKKAQALAETFLEFLKVYAKDGWSGVAKAAAATTSGEILAELFAGSAKDGTADTGTANGPGLDGQGGMPWLIHPKEAIITAEGNAANPGLAQAMIDGTVDEYFKTNFLPTMNVKDILPMNNDSMLLSAYIAKTDELIKTVKNKKEVTYSRNYLGETVRDEVENGVRSIITEKKYRMLP